MIKEEGSRDKEERGHVRRKKGSFDQVEESCNQGK